VLPFHAMGRGSWRPFRSGSGERGRLYRRGHAVEVVAANLRAVVVSKRDMLPRVGGLAWWLAT